MQPGNTWRDLFGAPDFTDADPGRSVVSPAAYLADLLQLLEDELAGSAALDARRPDITREVVLNGEGAFSPVPQLDIVNRVLSARIAAVAEDDADKVLAAARHPLELPFEPHDERLRRLLPLLKTAQHELYAAFARDLDGDVVARARLGLSPARAAILLTDTSADLAALRLAFGLAADADLAALASVAAFRRVTGLDAAGLRALLFARLGGLALDKDGKPERDAAGLLFIHQGLGGHIALDDAGEALVWRGAGQAIPPALFDRVHRLLRLSRWTGIDLIDLDLALRQLCDGKLDARALRRLAVLVELRDRTGEPIEALCAILGELGGDAALGASDDPAAPASLFDRVFNGEPARLVRRYVPSGCAYTPALFAGRERLEATGDILSDDGRNRELRGRIQRALGLSARDLQDVVTRLRDRAVAKGRASVTAGALGIAGLTALYRVARLARLTDVGPLAVLDLLAVLEGDPGLRKLDGFDVLVHDDIQQADLHRVLEQGPIDARVWLVQHLLAVAAWATAEGLTPADLAATTRTDEVQVAAALPAHGALRVHLRILRGLYIVVGASRRIHAAAVPPDASAAFTMVDRGEGQVTLQASNGLFVGVHPQSRSLFADRAAAGPTEIFAIEGKGSGRVALRASNGKYLTSGMGDSDAVLALVDTVGDASIFQLLAVDDAAPLPTASTSSSASPADDPLLRVSQALLTAFQPVALRPEVLAVGGVSPRAARIAVDLVREPGRGLVAAADPRIVTWDADAARDADDDVLTTLDVVTVADLEELQLGDALAELLAGLLVRRGLLDREGVLRDDRLPARAEDLVIETDWGARTSPVLIRLKSLRADAQALDPEDESLALFPVDLRGLGFERAEADELLEQLTFLELLDETGAVTVPDIFDDLDDPTELRLGLGLGDHRPAIHEFLVEQRDRWLAAPLRLPDDLWAELPLTDGEREELERNLAFNGHIDGERRILDRAGLIARTPDNFDLALPFYRHRRKILAALQGFVAAARASALTLDAGRLRPLADRLVAASIHAALSRTSLDADGRPNAPMREFLSGERRILDFGPLASTAHVAPISDLLRRVVGESEVFRLTDAALATVDLAGEHATRVIDTLVADGVLRPDRTLVPGKLQAFTRVRGALDFDLRGYTDYARDVFFLLHDVAVTTEAHVTALTGALRDLAAAQSAAMHDVLSTELELAAPAVDVLLRQVLRDVPSPTAAVFGPVLAAAGDRDTLDVPPADRRFAAALRRTRQFAGFAARLGMSGGEIEVAFRDQQLVEKFPEAIALPEGVDRIDVLWTSPEGLVYLFCGPRYWTFDAASLAPREQARPLAALLPDLAGAPAVDAVFTTPAGEHWLLAQGGTWQRAADGDRWVGSKRVWGQLDGRFRDHAKIDGALVDDDGRLCLFAGEQYVRYSTWPQESVDEGYPRRIAAHWPAELGFGPLPAGWSDGIEAAVGRPGEVTWLFRGDRFVASTEPGTERPIVDTWGRVRHDLASASRVDAVLDLDGRCAIVVGDQVTAFDGALECADLVADPGFPRTLAAVYPGLPEAFTHGVDAGLVDQDGTVHLFRDQTHARRAAGTWTVAPAHERWGRVRNNLQATGRVDAALCGLDGKVYLFSGDQYVRYSGGDFSRVDEGYPRSIVRDWGGLVRVDAAFALDGKTYVFGRRGDEDDAFYLRFSSRDYRTPDVGYPRPTDDNFWNLPQALVERFAAPQAVFVGPDGRTYLFSGDQVISFSHNHRWWTEPAPLREVWSNLPFERVAAALTARDGRTYFFSDEPAPRFVRYTDPTFARVDDRFPRPVQEHWGRLVNNLARTGRVDAALTVVSPVALADADGIEAAARYRYLFSGDQYVRYSSDTQEFVDEGYPRRIHDALRHEPHFANLDAPIARGVDGVWADAGNVFVFVGDQVHAASTAHTRQPVGIGVPEPRAVDLDQGALTVFSDGAWRSVRSPESLAPRTLPAAPRPLRGAPAAFQGALTAILRGLDGNTYLFAAERCWDPSLARDYPTGAAWGLVRNRVAEDGRVDAALWGRDGKLHLFRGDQCLTYTPAKATPTVLPALADAAPTTIAARWGGLADVRHAFVRRGVTYLLAAPDERGAFRYVRYSGPDYARPDDPEPLAGDGSFWQLPAELVELGFDRPEAVFAERDDLLLIRGRQFVHHRPGPDGWSAPRALALRWPGLPTRAPDFDALVAIAAGPDGATHFFSTGAHLTHDGAVPGELAAIESRWGRLDNRIALTHRVDATLVHGEHTFLFSADQYVRYTGPDYRYVDPDYPRPIAERLREEDLFRHLPAALEDRLRGLKLGAARVEAACVAGGTVYLQIAGRTFAVSHRLRRDYPLSHFARLRNDLQRRARVDAAFRRPDGALYLLSGEQYVRYSGLDLDLVDDGYPRRIADDLLRELADAPPALPAGFTHDLDATFHADQSLVLFKDRSFVRFDTRQPGAALAAQPIADTFGRVHNIFLTPQLAPRPIDAAVIAADGALLLFKDDKYLRYSDPAVETADEGFPAAIRDHFGDLPPAFEAGIDGAFEFDGRWYMCRGAQHVRFADPMLTRIDPIYPQPFATRWRRANDYSLRDLRIVQRYVALDRNSAADVSLTDFLRRGARDNADPYALLAARFDWEVADVQWLKRRAAFLGVPDREEAAEVRFDLEQLLRIHATMELASRLDLPPRDLFEQVWRPLFGDPRAAATAADTLGRALASRYTGADGATIERQLGDALRGARRDALVAWLMAHDPTRPAERRDLSDLLLTDVEMDPSAETSAVREAIGALQLYFHRYALGLDRAEIGADDEDRRERFQRRWRWLKNYRVWEANRRVFLFPESYARPELRDTRTAAFRTLQDDLVQGEITDASVTQAYKKYLDEYTEVSRLVIAGGFVQPGAGDPTDRELMLFGFTRTQPRRYYYRHATFFKGDARTATWRAWRPLGVEIGADRVHPVRAFGRAFVFWVELTQKSPAAASASLKIVDTDGGKTVSRDEELENHITVSYSFYDLNEQWSAPQRLKVFVERGKVDDLRLGVTRVDDPEAGSKIVVACHYGTATKRLELPPIRLDGTKASLMRYVERASKLGVAEAKDLAQVPRAAEYSTETLVAFGARVVVDTAQRHPTASLTADLEVRDGGEFPAADRRTTLVSSLFAEPHDAGRAIELSATADLGDGPWYSVDIKGASFLALPTAAALAPPRIADLANNGDGLPAWNRVDACLVAKDNAVYLFRDQVYARLGKPGEKPADAPLGARWGLVKTAVLVDQRVDAAWWRDGILYLARGAEYLTYSSDVRWADPVGPRPLPPPAAPPAQAQGFGGLQPKVPVKQPAAPPPRPPVPDWPSIHAAFTDASHKTWFFRAVDGRQECVTIDADLKLEKVERPWGLDRNEFTRPLGDEAVVGAFSVDGGALADKGRTFLIGAKTFTWYEGRQLDLCEPPRPQSLRAVLELLGATSKDPLPDGLVILGVLDLPGELVFKVGPANAAKFFRVKDRAVTPVVDPQAQELRTWLSATSVKQTTYCLTSGGRVGLQERRGGAAQTDWSDRFDTGPAVLLAVQDRLYVYARGQTPAWIRVDLGDLGADGGGKGTLVEAAITRWNSDPKAPAAPWVAGRTRNAFSQAGKLRGALRRGDKTFLLGGDAYVRYTGDALDLVDEGYPRPLKGNPDGLPEAGFDAAVDGVDGRTCFFIADRHAFGDALATTFPLAERWGQIRTNILTRGVDAAYALGDKHYLFSGDEVAVYTADAKGELPRFMDKLQARDAPFFVGDAPTRGALSLTDRAYLFSGAYFNSLAPASVVDAFLRGVGRGTPLRGGWDNLPALFHDGIDAGFVTEEGGKPRLVLFRGGRYAVFVGDGLPCESGRGRYDLVRLTSSTASTLNRRLFEGGIAGLLGLRSQLADELPGFSPTDAGPTLVKINPGRVNMDTLPTRGSLDFTSANGLYYWEIFFHAPLLIADTLRATGRHDEARAWYQHIYDPTAPGELWKFLPFLTVDLDRLVARVRDQLARGGWRTTPAGLELEGLAGELLAMAPAFRGERDLAAAQLARLAALADLAALRAKVKQLDAGDPERARRRDDLLELVGVIEELRRRWDGMQSSPAQLAAYLDDPLDPHAIASLRPIAYRKAAVLNYVGNLLDWGDALFAQYTRESIDQARMLYVQAWDLLGRRPESLGRRALPPEAVYGDLRNVDPAYDLLLVEKKADAPAERPSFAGTLPGTPHASVARTYFFIPTNDELHGLWTRVADRLHKIRHGLDLQGVRAPLALFEPPLDPAAAVRAVAAGGLAAAGDLAAPVDVPHHRFAVLFPQAQALADRAAQLATDLLLILEKRDAEELSRLQCRHEGEIVALTAGLQRTQLAEVEANRGSIEKARENAQRRLATYDAWLAEDYLPLEKAQLGLLTGVAVTHFISAVLQGVRAGASAIPRAMIGLFIAGVQAPESERALDSAATMSSSVAAGLQTISEILGLTAQHERMKHDWRLQRDLAAIDVQQFDAQLRGADLQIAAARQQIAVTERQIAHNATVATFYRGKFTNRELYQWMLGRLTAIHHQTYQLALNLARATERAYQFERGVPERDATFIRGQYWDAPRQGLTAGAALGLDLARMQAAFLATDARRFEIGRRISLIQLDPLAFLRLKAEGSCEFDLGEALFNRDFPGHFGRQIKTVAVELQAGEGVYPNATLTQLGSRVVMEPDVRAVAFLLDPTEAPPPTIRHDWRARQQAVLSCPDDGEKNNGVFSRFDTERYLPFEGTGAVSRWRLELGGRAGAYDPRDLLDVVLDLKYSARPGGEAFAAAVRGLLKPTDALRCFDLAREFADAWGAFISGDDDVLTLTLDRSHFADMASGRIGSIFARYVGDAPGAHAFTLEGTEPLRLADGKTVETGGALTIRQGGTTLTLRLRGAKTALRSAYLVMSYKEGVR